MMFEVVCGSSCDPRHPPHNVADEKEGTFWMTTGMFPQMLVVRLVNNRNNDAPVDIEMIRTSTTNGRRARTWWT